MRITRAETFPIELPFRERYLTARGELTGRRMVVLALRTDEGLTGWGEAVPLSLRGGPDAAQLAAELGGPCAEALLGGERLTEGCGPKAAAAWARAELDVCRKRSLAAGALAAVDVALHDLAGQVAGAALWRLLGASGSQPVPCNASVDAREPAAAAESAAAAARAGFATFKVKVGRGADVERVEAVRAAIGTEAGLRVDANGAWGRQEAISAVTVLAEVDLESVEQPCEELADLAAVRRRTNVRVVADESIAGPADADAAQRAEACDAVTLKLAKVGGPLAALETAARLPSYLSSALDGPIGIAAALHTAQALPAPPAWKPAHGLATLGMFSSTYAPVASLYGPSLQTPRGPGLGVEVDERALRGLSIR